ncbi:MAG: hypothetical protein FJ279_18835 [Planctomycetes bacterium]|nr:hypothetical protein [Planctomycetota bacterium]MBM4079538.1 hypothetical protein [Planctomycetota bacterium]MBM4083269.1 hypothetical protein [Planctomycetota bacterium]
MREQRLLVLVAGVFGLFAAAALTQEPGDRAMQIGTLLPRQIDGWRAGADDKTFTRDTIFEYMDGAGEIYLAYDFQRLLVRQYAKAGAPALAAEVYQMESSEDAFGIFSHDLDGQEVALGQGARYAAGFLRFWKDRVFVRLLAERETDETRAVLMALGKQIASAIPREGKRPLLVDCLPTEGLLSDSVRYFHKQVSLNCYYYLADGNLLNLSERTEAVLGRYQRGEHKVWLLVVRYPDAQEARSAHEQFQRIYFRGKPSAESPARVEKVERGEFVSVQWEDRFLTLVFEAQDKETCVRLSDAVTGKLKEVSAWKRQRAK